MSSPAAQQQLEDFIGSWFSAASGIPYVRAEQTDGNGSAPPHPSAANTGSDTWASITLLDGPRLEGRAQTGLTDENGAQSHTGQRSFVASVKAQGPRAVYAMGKALETLDDGSAQSSLQHAIYGPIVFRHVEGPRSLQTQLETGYLRVSQADLTFFYQETWTTRPGWIERVEGTATVIAPDDEIEVTLEGEDV